MNFLLDWKLRIPLLGVLFVFISYYLHLVLGAFYAPEYLYGALNLLTYLLCPIVVISTLKYFDKNILLMYFLIFTFFIIMIFSNNSYYMDYYDFLKFFSYLAAGFLFFLFLKDYDDDFYLYGFFYFLISISTFNFDPAILDYLYYADAYVLLSFLMLFFAKNIYSYIFIFIVSVVSLYFINSRSALFFFIGSFSLLMVYIYGLRKSFMILIPMFFVIYGIIFYLYENTDIQGNRVLRIIFSSDDDTSFNERNIINEYAKQAFLNSPFVGAYGDYRGVFGYGKYAHNYFSFLSEYGFFGGIFLVAMYIYLLKSIFLIFYNKYLFRVIRGDFKMVLLICVYALLGITFTKTYRWFFLYLSIGFSLSFLFFYYGKFYQLSKK